jgi:chromosomal replication initiation ATPase DnaA
MKSPRNRDSERSATLDIVNRTADAHQEAAKAKELHRLGRLPIHKVVERLAAVQRKPDKSDVAKLAKAENETRWALWKALKPPALYEDVRIDEPVPDWWQGKPADVAAYEATRQTIGRFVSTWGILVLTGPRGTGKTRLGWAAIREACRFKQSARYRKAEDLFIDTLDSFGRRGAMTVRKLVDSLIFPDFLVIDELSEMQADKDWQLHRLTYIMDRRYDEKKRTILISNDTKPTFWAKIGESIQSRLRERGAVVECLWPSFRERRKDNDSAFGQNT